MLRERLKEELRAREEEDDAVGIGAVAEAQRRHAKLQAHDGRGLQHRPGRVRGADE